MKESRMKRQSVSSLVTGRTREGLFIRIDRERVNIEKSTSSDNVDNGQGYDAIYGISSKDHRS